MSIIKKVGLVVSGLAVVAFVGCAPLIYGTWGSEKWFNTNEWGREAAAKKASFEMDCPSNQLEFTPLGSQSDGYEQIGVSGCGRRTTYIFVQGKWVANTSS